MAQVQAKQSFYHDLVGSRAMNEVFEVNDQATLQTLEEQGYVQRVSGEMAQAQAKQQQTEKLMGQAQALTNEAVSLAHHAQNMEANNHTQQLAQEAQQRAEQKGESHTNQADHAAVQAHEKQFQPTATPNPAAAKATAKKADK